MKAENLYENLNTEFELEKLSEEEWSLLDLGDYIAENFTKRWMGLVLDNSSEIKKVYTAVFPSERVLDYILAKDEKEVLLFTHHPMIWDNSTGGFPFRNIPVEHLERLKQQSISHYAIHVPLDRNGPYSTSVSLARALKIEADSEFFDYQGVKVGTIGRTECKTVMELAEQVEDLVGHNVKVWDYGDPKIANQMVALVGGGGNYPEIAEELSEIEVRTFVTGVTMKLPSYEPSLRFHDICRDNKINVISATHYSTEKFACIAVLELFERLGLPCEFVEDEPDFEDFNEHS